jgi:hypothetical protein
MLAYYEFRRWYEFEERRWNDTDRGNRRTRRKTCPSATLSTTNPTWIDPGANPGLRGERPAPNYPASSYTWSPPIGIIIMIIKWPWVSFDGGFESAYLSNFIRQSWLISKLVSAGPDSNPWIRRGASCQSEFVDNSRSLRSSVSVLRPDVCVQRPIIQ